ncbi:MAG: type II toxin-antitoxin system HigB family toxin, partial [Betaproteobacteria bacterium]
PLDRQPILEACGGPGQRRQYQFVWYRQDPGRAAPADDSCRGHTPCLRHIDARRPDHCSCPIEVCAGLYAELSYSYHFDILGMHIISLKTLREFWKKHPAAQRSLRNWHTVSEHSDFVDFAHLRQSFGTADYASPYTVFDVGGNKYRIIAVVRYRDRKIFVRWVMTHRDYDEWCKLYRKGKV